MLFEPLDEILGRRSSVRLLRALIPLERPVSGREAARLAKLSHRAIISLEDLAHLGLVLRREAAGQHLYSFNRAHVLSGPLQKLFEAEERRTVRILGRLSDLAGRSGAVYAGVFGSAARKEAGPASDLDVLVVVPSAEGKEEANEMLIGAAGALEEQFGVRVSPVILALEQVKQQYGERSPLIEDVLREGRRVHGPPLEELIGG